MASTALSGMRCGKLPASSSQGWSVLPRLKVSDTPVSGDKCRLIHEIEVKCDYTCIFGISKSCPGVRPGDMNSVLRDKASYLAIGGSQGRTYWFRFQKLPKRLYGSEIPRYTPEDVDRTVDSFRHEYILPGV